MPITILTMIAAIQWPYLPGLASVLAIGLLLVLVWITAQTWYGLTRPPRRTYASALARGTPGDPSELLQGAREYKSWAFQSDGLWLPVWEIPGDRPDGPVIILSHGWGSSRIGALSRVPALLPLASCIIAWDMRGQGDAPGTCSLGARETRDLRLLCAEAPGDGPVVLMGWSLGAGISIAAACGVPRVAAVIAEAPYRHVVTPARNMLLTNGMPGGATLDIALAWVGLTSGVGPKWNQPVAFDRAWHAAQLSCPLLVLHGDADSISPTTDGREIAAAARDGTYINIPTGGHQSLWIQPDSAAICINAVRDFISRRVIARPPS
jgi:pimeloyl-ACP methyl ester carboxylesterase